MSGGESYLMAPSMLPAIHRQTSVTSRDKAGGAIFLAWAHWGEDAVIMRVAEFLRDLVARQVVTLRHVPGRVMIADLLTKSVSRQLFMRLLQLFDAYSAEGVVCPE